MRGIAAGVVWSLLSSLWMASAASAVSPETALRASTRNGPDVVGASASQLAEWRRESGLGYGGEASDSTLSAKGPARDAAGRLRNADGTFAPDGGRARAPGGAHGNTAGDQPATLYERYDADGNFLKHGISQDPARRYTQAELDGGYLIPKQIGPRSEILKIERDLVETNPGPLNKEPWAGRRKK
jgi:hypothetical protein